MRSIRLARRTPDVCAPPPLGPNNHANAAGYQAMAEAFAVVLLP